MVGVVFGVLGAGVIGRSADVFSGWGREARGDVGRRERVMTAAVHGGDWLAGAACEAVCAPFGRRTRCSDSLTTRPS